MGTGTFARFSCTSERTHEGAIHGIVCCGKVVHATGVKKDCFAIENKGDGTAIAWSKPADLEEEEVGVEEEEEDVNPLVMATTASKKKKEKKNKGKKIP